MHFARFPGFDEVAHHAGHENTAAHYLAACHENGIVMSIVMGNASGGKPQFGGIVPQVPDLAGPFDLLHYNQGKEICYCVGIQSEQLTLANCEASAKETERFLKTPQCVGIKIYTGYNRSMPRIPVTNLFTPLPKSMMCPSAFTWGRRLAAMVF